MSELDPPDQELVDQGIIPEYPRGLTAEEFTIAARGLRRTTPTGRRAAGGTPITVEGEEVAEMMELNRLRVERERGK
ncbi:TPA: hypothetical protein DIS56_01890 [Candidatus Saccharibacteria bacterium]|nr:MAG: hypothetical protein UX30_C0002G0011 [Candidatus Saccharibacteria bacterium GW2011_GWA2_46_10]OGL34588.1 MAG: hypothetical protein A3F05_01560 [Candidatus Saccharibacteria bacterium RIFCSPHIGHO2_12_FULL_47_17]HCM51861.1 hypothetical protein [Candidatus Saccharibacteria bacterium]